MTTRTVVIRITREKRLTLNVRGMEIDADANVPMNRVEAAAFLGMTAEHLSRLTTGGEVPAHYLGKRPKYFKDELADWLRSK